MLKVLVMRGKMYMRMKTIKLIKEKGDTRIKEKFIQNVYEVAQEIK